MSRILAIVGVVVLGLALLIAGIGQAPRQRHRAFLGIVLAPLSRAVASRTPLFHGGAEIAYVYPKSPADQKKLEAGEVVVAIDGQKVESAEQAAGLIGSQKAGDVISLVLLDVARGQTRKPELVRVVMASAPAHNEQVYTVHAPRLLAREGSFGPAMAANAAWSPEIAHGAINPYPLRLFAEGVCSALAPYGWRIVGRAGLEGFALWSAGGHVRSFYRRAKLNASQAADPALVVSAELASMFGQAPQLGPMRSLAHGFSVSQFATSNDYAGFALERRDANVLSLWVAGVPATEVEGLLPYAGATALSIRCAHPGAVFENGPTGDLAPTSVSSRCLSGRCDESDFAGAYNEVLHTGYVHAPTGENFLIDPRKDIWAMGPDGPGTYRQNNGVLEKLRPGRTN